MSDWSSASFLNSGASTRERTSLPAARRDPRTVDASRGRVARARRRWPCLQHRRIDVELDVSVADQKS